MPALINGALRGAAAGAAGSTALDTVGYLDMVMRARPASSTPEVTVERMADRLGVSVPGTAEQRENRVAGLGPLTGYVAGIGLGALLGLARSAGWRPATLVCGAAATVGALIGTNGPMTVLGVTDPRTWAPQDWVADVVPHLAYAAVTVAMIEGLDRPHHHRCPRS